MRKMLGVLLLAVMVIGVVPMLASAECSPDAGAVGTACVDGGVVTLDGNDSNPDPFDGSIVVDTNNGTICADSKDPDDVGYDPICAP